MKVRLLEGRADAERHWMPGDEIDVPDAEGKALIERGDAEPVAQKRSDNRETRSASR